LGKNGRVFGLSCERLENVTDAGLIGLSEGLKRLGSLQQIGLYLNWYDVY